MFPLEIFLGIKGLNPKIYLKKSPWFLLKALNQINQNLKQQH